MDSMITCIACNEERRADRMSNHILSKHRDNITKCKPNQEILEAVIKHNDYSIKICLSNATNDKEQRVHCSFGYVSGWKTDKMPQGSIEKAKKNRTKHIEECKKLLTEMNPSTEKNNSELAISYKNLERKYKRLESDYDDINTDSMNEMVAHNTLLDVIAHMYQINKKELSKLEDGVREILNDDSLTDEQRQKTIRQTYLK